jgi:ribosomal protein S27AE
MPHTLNYVIGYNELFRSHLKFILWFMQAIPKKNFVADKHAIKSIKRVIEAGGRVVLFPEGMSSISGTNQPCATSTGKLLKNLGIPVVVVKTKGGYFVNTKYNMDVRPGKVEVELDALFSPEDLERMPADEIQVALDKAIKQDDYEWNVSHGNSYKTDGKTAEGLHTLLYRCPKCGEEFRMTSHDDLILCEACGNGAKLTEKYELIPLNKSCVIPKDPRVWYDEQRNLVREWILDDNFELSEHVEIGVLPEKEYLKDLATSVIVGEGELVLNRSGLHFKGKKNGDDFEFDVEPRILPTYGMCTDVTRFYTFAPGEYIEFYPSRPVVAKWFLATEENHRYLGGSWQDFNESYYKGGN